MPRYGYPHSKHAAIISLFLYENKNLLYPILSKLISKYTTSNKFSRSLIPHSKRAGKVIIFYFQILIAGNVLRQNLIKIYTKTHQIAPYFIIFSEELATEPLCHAQHAVLRHAYIHF